MDSKRYQELANALEQQAVDQGSPGAEKAARELARGYARLAERAARVEEIWDGSASPACDAGSR